MALIKKTELDNTGYSLEYWKIAHAHYDSASNNWTVHLSGYKDRNSRIDGKSPTGEAKSMVFDADNYPLSSLDEKLIDTTLVTGVTADEWFRNFMLHCLYVHIIQSAKDAVVSGLGSSDLSFFANAKNEY